MSPELYAAIVTRANGRCECGTCGMPVPPGEVDHHFGRAKAATAIDTCWLLTPTCHFAKTNNAPSARAWLARFIAHCAKHGYAESKARAEAKLEFLKTKHDLTADMLRRRNA